MRWTIPTLIAITLVAAAPLPAQDRDEGEASWTDDVTPED